MILYLIIYTILFCIFVELYVGSISIRLNSENQYTFNILNMIYYLINPFHNNFLWNPQLLLVNYPFMLVVFILINLIYDKLINSNNGILERSTFNTTTGNFKEDIL